MPATYDIDARRGLVVSTATGVLTGEDIRQHQARLKSDPLFRPSFNQLADFTTADEVRISPEEVRQLAYDHPFRDGSKRAVVINRPLDYGMVRIFQALTEGDGPDFRIFSDMAEARRWLGLEESP